MHALKFHELRTKSGAEATAVQTLARWSLHPDFAKRLDCGAFTAVFRVEKFLIDAI